MLYVDRISTISMDLRNPTDASETATPIIHSSVMDVHICPCEVVMAFAVPSPTVRKITNRRKPVNFGCQGVELPRDSHFRWDHFEFVLDPRFDTWLPTSLSNQPTADFYLSQSGFEILTLPHDLTYRFSRCILAIHTGTPQISTSWLKTILLSWNSELL